MAQPSHREQLIAGAVACLQTKGYARTTARDIAAAAGANLASIGYHFGSKEALLNEALVRILDERDRQLAALTLADDSTSPLERLTRVFNAVLGLFEANRPMLVAFLEAIIQAEHSEDLRDEIAAQYRRARQNAAALIVASFGPDADRLSVPPEDFASFLIAALDGLVIQMLLAKQDTPTGTELITALKDTMRVANEIDR